MKRNSFVEMAKLHNLSGRITYISSHTKQEHLYEVYATETDKAFWRELAKCNQEEFEKSGTNGKCIEARELMIALPESFINYDHDYLLKKMVDEFKQKYGVECFAALHHNKRKTNLHIHMIFAERKRLDQPEEKTATRHIHHAKSGGGQILICTAGSGWYQEEGKVPVSLEPGTVITIPPEVKHWHGAKADSWFRPVRYER